MAFTFLNRKNILFRGAETDSGRNSQIYGMFFFHFVSLRQAILRRPLILWVMGGCWWVGGGGAEAFPLKKIYVRTGKKRGSGVENAGGNLWCCRHHFFWKKSF